MFERIPHAMLMTGDDRIYVDCNAAAELLLECSREQIIGRSIEDFTPVAVRHQVPAAWAAFIRDGSQEGTYEILTATGKRVTVEFSATANFLPGLHLSILIRAPEPGIDLGDRESLFGRRLSLREREVLEHLAMGANGQQIAAELFISPETVRTHLRNILTKLDAQTRAHAIALALRQGEITAELIGSAPSTIPQSGDGASRTGNR